jgi:hypothetical protein
MGAPFGNRNAANAKRWQQAVNRALAKRSKAAGIEELDRLAEKFLDAIEEMTIPTEKRGPSIAGFIELADRIDGKSDQHVSVSGIRAEELNDDELGNIASAGRDGIAEASSSAPQSSGVH